MSIVFTVGLVALGALLVAALVMSFFSKDDPHVRPSTARSDANDGMTAYLSTIAITSASVAASHSHSSTCHVSHSATDAGGGGGHC